MPAARRRLKMLTRLHLRRFATRMPLSGRIAIALHAAHSPLAPR